MRNPKSIRLSFSLSKWREIGPWLGWALFCIVAALVISRAGIIGAAGLFFLPVSALVLFFFFRYPVLGLYGSLIMSYMVPTLGRYLPVEAPFGLSVDIFLILTLLILFFKHFQKLNLWASYNIVFLAMSLWFVYVMMQVVNPQARSVAAWFYAMRGVALYQWLIVIISFSLLQSRRDFYRFAKLWLGLTFFSALWGVKQKLIGVDGFEQAWLDAGAGVQHLLFGKLRIFGNYTDAGTYGPAMAHTGVAAGILAFGPYRARTRVALIIVSLISLYAMLISGTRGALGVPAAGGLMFLILTKNLRLLSLGGGAALMLFLMLKFTSIGSGNYDIQRLRTALDPNDPSLMVRVINRQRLDNYLADKPFGGGVGSAGFWGARFTPGTWLADFPTDGLYTRIKAETGIVGYYLYIGMWLVILGAGIYVTWGYDDPERKYISIAALAGFSGMLLTSYGNEVINQIPNIFFTIIPVAFVFLMQHWDKEGNFRLPEKDKKSLFKYLHKNN